jgi:hypothetical protein
MNSRIKNFKNIKDPFLIFLPFLIAYILLIVFFSPTQNYGDESRYLNYANNLLKGFYSPPPPKIDLGNGPGYPLILTPFLLLNLPVIFIKVMNAFFYYLSLILLFKALQELVTFRFAILFSLAWAFYPSIYENLLYVLPEVFSVFLISLLIYFLIKSFRCDPDKKGYKYYVLFAGITFGYLALTKPIFGYVILTMILIMGIIFLIRRQNKIFKKAFLILIIAFISTSPYLAYTYHLTGRVFYWSTYGGNNLYWMSSPNEKEYGSWAPSSFNKADYIEQETNIPGYADSIIKYHKEDFAYVNEFNGIEHDDAYKKLAIKNIQSYPLKFIQNCISNLGRMIFNYPYSYKIQNPGTLFRFPFNGALVFLMTFCTILGILNWTRLEFSLRFLLLFSFIYLGGSLLGSAETRMFTLIVPVFLIWIAYILKKTVVIKPKW